MKMCVKCTAYDSKNNKKTRLDLISIKPFYGDLDAMSNAEHQGRQLERSEPQLKTKISWRMINT